MDFKDIFKDKVVLLDESVLTAYGFRKFIMNTMNDMYILEQKYSVAQDVYDDLNSYEDEDSIEAINTIQSLMDEDLLEIIAPAEGESIVRVTDISEFHPVLFISLDKKTALNLEMMNRMKSYTGKKIEVYGINKMGDLIQYK